MITLAMTNPKRKIILTKKNQIDYTWNTCVKIPTKLAMQIRKRMIGLNVSYMIHHLANIYYQKIQLGAGN